MNLFRPALKDDFFDVVISNGVLHHTGDCRGAFRRIGRLVRPGRSSWSWASTTRTAGKLHYARRALFRWTGMAGRWLDPHFGKIGAAGKREAGSRISTCHPHETCHTLDEVLGWMDEDGFEFVNSIPKPRGRARAVGHERLFEPRDRGTALQPDARARWRTPRERLSAKAGSSS